MTPFDIRPIKGKLLEDIKDIVRRNLNKEVSECVGIARRKRITTKEYTRLLRFGGLEVFIAIHKYFYDYIKYKYKN